jgi:hypothetical protein
VAKDHLQLTQQLKQAACLMIPVMASSNFKPAIVQIGNVP